MYELNIGYICRLGYFQALFYCWYMAKILYLELSFETLSSLITSLAKVMKNVNNLTVKEGKYLILLGHFFHTQGITTTVTNQEKK